MHTLIRFTRTKCAQHTHKIVAHVSVIYPATSTYRQAAQICRTLKSGCSTRTLTPPARMSASIGTEVWEAGQGAYGVGQRACSSRSSEKSSWESTVVVSASRDMSVELCTGTGVLYRQSLGALACASGSALTTGMPVTTQHQRIVYLLFECETVMCLWLFVSNILYAVRYTHSWYLNGLRSCTCGVVYARRNTAT